MSIRPSVPILAYVSALLLHHSYQFLDASFPHQMLLFFPLLPTSCSLVFLTVQLNPDISGQLEDFLWFLIYTLPQWI